ncbi:MAG: hypothetical protein BHW15_06115 [Coprococcus sp. CAG:131_42_139]|nr:MAG: hypothetical protein BHW15_06115 [Coprococcus sp. CAG:131_42_139]
MVGRFLAMAALGSLLLTGCGTKVDVPDMSSMGTINVVSREEGSGTKTEFDNLVDTDATGTNTVADSTDNVISQVASDKNAIGYIAYSAENNSGVKVLDVDGTAPDTASVEKDKYSLCRDYILVYSGELSAVAKDFMAYVKSAGQAVVADYCVPVKKSETFLSDKSGGTVEIHGSTSAAPIVSKLAEEYMKINQAAKIVVTESDSTQGLNDALQGRCDLGMSSRSLQPYESELLTSYVFGRDAIAVIVNSENPLSDISVDMLKKIYDKKYTEWGDLK